MPRSLAWPLWARIGLTLGIGYLGALLAPFLHLPVPALLGSAIVVALAALAGLPLAMPVLLRNIGFTILGTSMGSAITAPMLALIGRWPLSLVGLVIAVVLMMLISTWLLFRYFGLDRSTALLASTPGALSTVVSIATEGGGDVRAVIVLQSLRLILVMAIMPVVIQALGLQGQRIDLPNVHLTLDGYTVAGLLLGAFALAWVLERLKVPAAYVLGGLFLSGVLHASGTVQGGLPNPLLMTGFVLIGCVVGERFQSITLKELRYFSLAAVISVSASSLIAASVAAVFANLLNLPFGQVWIAYAPGGIEAMAALALALHYDPAYIAAHHLFRIIGITLGVPWLVKWMQRT